MENHHQHPSEKISPSSVYYCPMECEGEKVYFAPGKRCPTCNMFLVPIEERADYKNKPQTYSKTNLPENFKDKIGEYFCPMFCEADKTYDSDIGCPVCHMHLEEITNELIQNSQFSIQSLKSGNPNPELGTQNAGKFYCPMFCEGDKVYDSNVGCPVCGMDLVQIPGKSGEIAEDKTYQILRNKFLIALSFTIPIFVLSMGGMWFKFPFSSQTQGFLELLLSITIIFYAGWFLLKRGWISFKTWNLNMFSLIALGSVAAFIFSLIALIFPNILPHEFSHGGKIPYYFESVAVILTLVIMGQMFEAKAHQKTVKAIEELINLSPKEAHLIINNTEKQIPLSEVKVGDFLRVKPGEKIPVDGKITEGNSVIDESMITGEPIPTEKNSGMKVTSGTINGNGSFIMVAEKVGDQTLLSQIIKMVNDATKSKAPIQKLADKISKIFVPIVIAISIFTFLLWWIFGGENALNYALINAVAVLIVACPCALGLATPMSLTVGISKGAKNGILIKNADALEQMHKVNVLITDKTGTLTEGKPVLEDIFTFGNTEKNDILKWAASLNQNSEHPLSMAVLDEFKNKNLDFDTIENFENISGKGLKGTIDGEMFLLGNESLMQEFGIDISDDVLNKLNDFKNEAKTISFLAKEKKVLGILTFSDKIKESSLKAIQYLQKNNIEVVMMTGDNEQTAKSVAATLGIKKYVANCLPQDKLKEIKKFQNQGKIVAMTGDGINDAPALAQANVGIAMGTGTDIAIESAEITLLNGNLLGVAKAKILSEKLLKNIKENLFFAFIYNILGIPIAAGLLYPFFGILLSPMIAAAAMSFSSISVILNSLRLNNTKLDIND